MSERVTLRGAYVWTCPECGIDQFERGIAVECSDEELIELREDHGIQPWETGNWMLMPKAVRCKVCHKKFPTVHDGDDEE
jgi:rubredoxin